MALELYKPEEATRSRGLLAVLAGGLSLFGVLSLYDYLSVGFWDDDLVHGLLGDEFPLSPRVILAAVLILTCALVIYLLANNHKIVDFLIATEKELEKVSWPPKHEVISSSIAVCVTTVVLAAYLGLVDFGLVQFKDSVWPKLEVAIGLKAPEDVGGGS
ncbi:MAG: preprotein translocase subunit SecE [Planctomycetota bacterium]|nr:MAG: preprotein translocase subunit SecE [Planctomycetota bacterium]